MKPGRFVVACAALIAAGCDAAAQESPAFTYDPARSARYLEPTPAPLPVAVGASAQIELTALVDEILDGPWRPLYSDYSAAQAGGRGPAEWAFTRPAEKFLALAEAARFLTAEQKEKAARQLADDFATTSPTRKLFVDFTRGKPRNIRQAPAPQTGFVSGEETERRLFTEAYAVWAYAEAFDAWEQARPAFADLKALRTKLEARHDFEPAYAPGQDAPLTPAVAADPAYRFTVYESLLSGQQDNYGYTGAREAQRRMQKGKPVFLYVKMLAALIGHYRLAGHFGDDAERDWARANFDRIAALALNQRSAPYLWCDESLTPELAQLLRDHAGAWLDELARTPSVGNLPATDWNENVISGRRDQRAINPYTWFQAWGGQGEGIRPRTVMAAFLVHATLFNAPRERVVQTRDIPWCKADLYYLRKLAVELGTRRP
ncbi:MAG TPA: hypothetical protein VGO11_08625 [Chthoniobacteraceae bacterium]|jgi:hypothetical protein|nr:hypothetical protein [Chthoniobacteraceae bacterium]